MESGNVPAKGLKMRGSTVAKLSLKIHTSIVAALVEVEAVQY